MSRKTGIRFVAPNARILIVDDDPMNLMIETNLLKPTKIKIDTAESGILTLSKVKEQAYDLILLDHMMPGMDGIETLHRLQEELIQKIPILVLTSNDELGAKEMYKACGFQDYLKKPITGIDLEEALLKWLPMQKVEQIYPKYEENIERPLTFIELELAEVIQLKKALSFSDNSTEVLYEHILLYANSQKQYEAQLIQAYDAMDIINYQHTIHALKGSSMLVGATTISSYAIEIESECKKSNWDYIAQNHDLFLREYEHFCSKLRAIMNNVRIELGAAKSNEKLLKDCLLRILSAAKVWDMVQVGEELTHLDEICCNKKLPPAMLSAKQHMTRAYEKLDYELFMTLSYEFLKESN